jgi:predicted transcriptional regulator
MDEKDILMLKLLQDNPAISLQELQQAIMCRSIATVHNRIVVLQKAGLVDAPPTKKQARSRKITTKGSEFLRANQIR